MWHPQGYCSQARQAGQTTRGLATHTTLTQRPIDELVQRPIDELVVLGNPLHLALAQRLEHMWATTQPRMACGPDRMSHVWTISTHLSVHLIVQIVVLSLVKKATRGTIYRHGAERAGTWLQGCAE